MRVIFVLPSAGGGGGSHSVAQEVLGLHRIGVEVAIATPEEFAAEFAIRYPELQRRGVENPVYGSVDELSQVIGRFDLAIATTALSVETVIEARDKAPGRGVKLGYYIQDYEPLFYPPGTREWTQARASFDLMKDALSFAKTDWLCSIVDANHNVGVRRVQASIDHDVYFPVDRRLGEPFRVTAMVRPKTARRAPKRTIRVLERIAMVMGPRAEVSFFGCDAEDLARIGLRPSDALKPLGVLDRAQVANLLRHSDLFLDLSDFQAFGRTGLEGMACGCVPVLPAFGGSGEYAEHGINSYVVDTRSDDEIVRVVEEFVNARPQRRGDMRDAAISTALDYSVAKAAYSEYRLFREHLGDTARASGASAEAA